MSQTAPLDSLLQNQDLWNIPADDFAQANFSTGFRWVSQTHDYAQTTLRGLTLFSLPVYQTLVHFEAGKPAELTVFFYNRGDAGELDKDAFFALRDKTIQAISGYTKVQPVLAGKDPRNAVKAEAIVWQAPMARFTLESSFTHEFKSRAIPFRAEFVRLQIVPVKQPAGFMQAALEAAKQPERFSGPTHVKRTDTGDVLIDGIPMVDQGDKGYCVVASAERVMRYYGLKVDEHELAQIANTSASGGTSNEAMFEALKKLSSRLHIKTRTMDTLTVSGILELVHEYNRIAHKGRQAPEINLSSHVLDVHSIYLQMKPDILKEARMHGSADSRFLRQIQPHLTQGIPVLWSVMLGIFPEGRSARTLGGHMRLLIGFNPNTNEVIYTDSWGMGHELKRMPLDQALAITTGLYTIEPM